MTYVNMANAILEARRLIADVGWPSVSILAVPFSCTKVRFSPVHAECTDWAKHYPTVVVIRPMPMRNV